MSAYRTGWCSGDSHERCPVVVAGTECACVCHDAELVVAEAEAAAPVSVVGTAGFHDGVEEDAYYRDRGSLSQSGIKTLLTKSPAHFQHEREHPRTSRAFEHGTAAHTEVLGVGPELVPLDFPDRRTKAFKEANEEARERGALPLLRKDYDVVRAMADKLSEHRLAMELLSVGRPEVSAYALDEPTGVMRRCRFDWLHPEVLVDYKSAENGDPRAFGRKAHDFGYHLQAPYYLDIAAALGHPAAAFAFIVQEKSPPYVVTVIELPTSAVERGRDLCRRGLEMFRDCTATGLWPGYVPNDAFAVSSDLPPWAYYDNETEISA